MNTPCATKTTCPCDSLPDTAYASEAADVSSFVSTQFARAVPPVGDSNWKRLDCQMTAFNPASQAAADQTALTLAEECAAGQVSPYVPDGTPSNPGSGGGQQTFVNAEQSCTTQCPDGTQFTYTVRAGQYTGSTQAAADAAANAVACQQVILRAICLSNLSNPTLNQAYTGTITATGGQVANNENTWVLVSGTLPPGLTFNGGTNHSTTISGKPTEGGTYLFSVQCIDSQGNTTTKAYSLTVQCATAATITKNTFPLPSIAPTAPYTSAYKGTGLPALLKNVEFAVNFNSLTSKKWNWQVVLTYANNAPASLSVTVNNQAQSGSTVLNGGNWTTTFVGSVSTNGCTAAELDVNLATLNGNGIMQVQWQTPS